ncbi:MAG: hypothetical protein N2558_04605, partial [Patescibacteria group bacterium]|nr:hypothetical protein [Patescibacteria group bacterium]
MKTRSLPELNSKTKSILERSEKVISEAFFVIGYSDDHSRLGWPSKIEIFNLLNTIERHKDAIGNISNPKTYDEIVLKQLYVVLNSLFISLRLRFNLLSVVQPTFLSLSLLVEKFDNLGFEKDALIWIKEMYTKLSDFHKQSYKSCSQFTKEGVRSNLLDHAWAQKELDKCLANFYDILEYSSYVPRHILSLVKKYPVVVDFSGRSSFNGRIVSFNSEQSFCIHEGRANIRKNRLLFLFAHEILGHVRHEIYVMKIKNKLPFFAGGEKAFLWSKATIENVACFMELEFWELLKELVSEKKLPSYFAEITTDSLFSVFVDNDALFWLVFDVLSLYVNSNYWHEHPKATVEEALDENFMGLWLSEFHREESILYVKQTVNPQNFSEINSEFFSSLLDCLRYSCFVVQKIFRKYPDVDKNRLYS